MVLIYKCIGDCHKSRLCSIVALSSTHLFEACPSSFPFTTVSPDNQVYHGLQCFPIHLRCESLYSHFLSSIPTSSVLTVIPDFTMASALTSLQKAGIIVGIIVGIVGLIVVGYKFRKWLAIRFSALVDRSSRNRAADAAHELAMISARSPGYVPT